MPTTHPQPDRDAAAGDRELDALLQTVRADVIATRTDALDADLTAIRTAGSDDPRPPRTPRP